MGYTTDFDIEITKNGAPASEEFDEILENAKEWRHMSDKIRNRYRAAVVRELEANADAVEKISGSVWKEFDHARKHGGDQRWYECTDHMKIISAAFPEFTFVVTGHGESGEDHWRRWFRAGQQQGGKATITYPQFSESAWEP